MYVDGAVDTRRLLLTDFEPASYKTATEIFGEMDVGGCWFHFKQALHKRLQHCGLAPKYSRDISFRLRLDSFAAMAFLRPEDVTTVFELIKMECDDAGQESVQYVEDTWVGRFNPATHRRKAPAFAVSLWNLHCRLSARTSNACERFHNRLALLNPGAPHPPMPKFVDMLKKHQRLTNLD